MIYVLDISREQYKMLLKIDKAKTLQASSLSAEELEICEYLVDHECIKARTFAHPDFEGTIQVQRSLPPNIELTQIGKAQLYAFRSTFYKWWIPVIISLFALITSVVAIVM